MPTHSNSKDKIVQGRGGTVRPIPGLTNGLLAAPSRPFAPGLGETGGRQAVSTWQRSFPGYPAPTIRSKFRIAQKLLRLLTVFPFQVLLNVWTIFKKRMLTINNFPGKT
jgi:hypothetical protein